MIMRTLKGTFLGLIAGYISVVLLSNWTWLSMRVNVSFAIFAFTFIGLLAGILIKNSPRKFIFYILELILLILFYVVYKDISVFTVIPGITLREGFFLNFISLTQANILLAVIMITANILWITPESSDYRRNLIHKEE